MPSKSIPLLIKGAPIPTGSAEYEATRASILENLAASVPEEFLLPQSVIDNAPKNVTAIPRECGLLTPKEIEITENHDAISLAEAIASRQLTSVEVVTAFAKRAIIAHQLTSCLTEFFMDEALQRAKELDDHLAATGKTVGPLHGVPVSIKIHIPIAGHWTSLGYVDYTTKSEKDCQMITILRNAGAVFYCKTNQPQMIMHLESTSIYGRVLNPHNTNLSAGGSTGGEAALIAMRGSVFGVGTDIGGSVRGPSAFCGIYGFKPTSMTLPTQDFLIGGYIAELNILASTGPMCTTLRDMDLFMSIMSAAKPYLEDPSLVPIPWTGLSGKPTSSSTPLKIGFMMNDGDIVPQPPVTKALEWARSRLEQAPGFEIKSFEPFQTAKAIKNIRLSYWPDGGKGSYEHLHARGEPILPLTEWILRDAAEAGELTATQLHHERVARDTFRIDFARHWEAQDVDLIISPAFVGPACSHDTALHWNYTAFWNYVDYPGVVVPTPVKAGAKGTEEYPAGEPLSDACKTIRQFWAEGDFEGAPINLQIVARRHHENDLFHGLEALKEVLQLK